MNILIVDDHPLVTELYETILLRDFISVDRLSIKTALDCKEAYEIITSNDGSSTLLDLAILDFNLPAYAEKKIFNGSDLARLTREYHQSCKIIIVTSHKKVLLVYNILKKIQPDGLAIKNDITTANLVEIVKTVLGGDSFQSPLVKQYVAEIWKKELLGEETNRQILYYLSKGYKVKELEKVVALAGSTIQRRVTELKKIFEVEDDNSLIKEVIKQGFL
jgi:DNA-binding NarL/FixJ family response regulator